MENSTMFLIDAKKANFRSFKALQRSGCQTFLQAAFVGWRQQCQADTRWDRLFDDLPIWFRLDDHAVALTSHKLRILAQQVQQAVRNEDSAYYQHLAAKTSRTYHAEGLNGLWKQLRSILPRNQGKFNQTHRGIDQELSTHFAHLEAREPISKNHLQALCYERNRHGIDSLPEQLDLQLSELPTLAEIECLCLKQRPRRAPGPDQVPADLCRNAAVSIAPHLHAVLTKAFVHGIEPFDYNGGRLCAIFKGKGDPLEASGYRGILLANTFAKLSHAWARSRLLPTLQSRRTIGQLGGLPSQQTSSGIQIVRLHDRIACHKQLSSATIFIDLKAAFHHMIREWIFSSKNELLQSTLSLSGFLDDRDFDLPRLQQDLDQICATAPEDMPPGLRIFLHYVHYHT